MPCPLFLEPSSLQPLEQFHFPGEITVECGGQQRFPEPPRPVQEHILVCLRQVVYNSCLVDVEVPSLDNVSESLHPDRVPYPFRLHSANLFYVLPSKIMNIPGFPTIFGNFATLSQIEVEI